MQGWLRIDVKDVGTKRDLAKWVRRGTKYARSLPSKRWASVIREALSQAVTQKGTR